MVGAEDRAGARAGLTGIAALSLALAIGAAPARGQVGPACEGTRQSIDEVRRVLEQQRSADARADASRAYQELNEGYVDACGGGARAASACPAIQGARDRASTIQRDLDSRYEQTQLSYLGDLSTAAFHVYLGLVGVYKQACGSYTPILVGRAAAVAGSVTATSPDGKNRQLSSGSPVYLGDRVVTDGGGRLQVLLLDETVFTIGPHADMVVDEFVYDPATAAGKLAATITKGVFRFVTGKIAARDPSRMKIKAGPVGVIGIRGTDFIVDVRPGELGVYVREGTVTFTESTSGGTTEIAAETSATFGERSVTTAPMTLPEWDRLVAGFGVAASTSPVSPEDEIDWTLVQIFMIAVGIALTMPWVLARRRRRLRAAAGPTVEAGRSRACASCGAAASPSARFCRDCGAALT